MKYTRLLAIVAAIASLEQVAGAQAGAAEASSQPTSTIAVAMDQPLGPAAGPLDWPHWRGPNLNGISPVTGINTDWTKTPPKRLWDFAMSDGGHAGPSVAAGKLFIVDHKGEDDIVRAIDLDSGKEVWAFPYPELAKEDHGHARCTPLYEDGRLYTLSRLGLVLCLDASNGRKLWSCDMAKDFGGKAPTWGYSMSLITDGRKLIVCPGAKDGAVAALDKLTGETIWKGGGSYKLGYATPVVATLAGRKQYLVFMGSHLVGVDAESGKELWNFPWAAIQCTATPLVLSDDRVFITTWYERKKCGAMLKITDKGPEQLWETKALASKMSTPVLHEGFLYGIDSETGSLTCLDPKDGTAKWQQKGFEHGGLCAVDGVLLALDGATGDLVMAEMSPAGYKELGRTNPFIRRPGGGQLRGNVWTAPIVAQGKVVVRDRNQLVCLDLK